MNPGAQVGPAIVNASAGRKVQKLFHCNYLIYKDLKPSLTKVFAKFSLNSLPSADYEREIMDYIGHLSGILHR